MTIQANWYPNTDNDQKRWDAFYFGERSENEPVKDEAVRRLRRLLKKVARKNGGKLTVNPSA